MNTESLIEAATAEFSRRYPRRNTNTYTAWAMICSIARDMKRDVK